MDIEALDQGVVSIQCSMDETVMQREEARAILQFIREQEEPVKSLLILRLIEETSFEEIGTILNQSSVWCRVTFFQAKKKLIDRIYEGGYHL